MWSQEGCKLPCQDTLSERYTFLIYDDVPWTEERLRSVAEPLRQSRLRSVVARVISRISGGFLSAVRAPLHRRCANFASADTYRHIPHSSAQRYQHLI